MPTYTVDASVFVNAFNPHEEGHRESHRFLVWVQEQAIPIIVPTLVFVEVAASISRGTDDTDLARRFARALERLPHLVSVPLDRQTAHQAGNLAAQYRLRGADAVYALVARRFGSVLVTRDQEQRTRVAQILAARLPTEVLDEKP